MSGRPFARLAEARRQTPSDAEKFAQLERDLIRTFYLGDIAACASHLAWIPGR